MRKRKQILAAALAGVMAFSLTACGKTNTAAGQTERIQQTERAQQTESRGQAEPTEETSDEANTASEENENGGTVVQTTAGLVQGTDEDGISRYLGIPYAQAEERFVPAAEVTAWEGIRIADSYGPISPQGAISGLGQAGNQDGTDNNSQNLNIWTPGVNDGEKRPVMVWLHGGGFSTGSANEEGYDGENLSRSGDVVVVSVNHRLNVFGYLDLSAYGEKYKDSANVGIRDIVDSLEWIQDNIEVFGGDPDNVTVFGQSGGGAKVLALMTSPYAEGLFHKGIVQSGATETMGVIFNSQEASTRLTENILKKLNITEDNIEDIQTVPVEELETAAMEALQETGEELKLLAALGGGYSMDWEPVVDGDFLPTNPVTEDSFAEAGADIPLLIGSNLNEWSGFFETAPIEPTKELETALREAYPDKTELTADQVDTTTIRLPLLKIMSHKADQKAAPVYAYVFTYGNSYHGAEIPYVFQRVSGSGEEQELAEQVSQAWINFARTGRPGAGKIPEWEPYTRESGATMLLDVEPELVYHHDQELLSILVPDYEY
jgi:para-nitrobenzyl esterase